jgi:hypothetical protein
MIIVVAVSTNGPLKVASRGELAKSADLAVAVGHAPDGLPLVIRIRRSRDVRPSVLSALGCSPSQLTPAVSSALEALQRVVGAQSLALGMGEVDGKRGYTSKRAIGSMLGQSLFAKALGDVGPLSSNTWDGGGERVAATCAGVVMSRNEVERMLGSAGATRKLFVPLPEGRPLVVDDNAAEPRRRGRPIIFESLATVPGVRIGYREDDLPLEQWNETSLGEPRAYRRALETAHRVAWWVPRHSLALALVAIAQTLQQMHGKGLVHGDVKPANLLLGEGGPVPIDPLGIESGRVATVCTPSWAAPEQVTARPVSPATDVFALGLVLAKIVNAVVFGEERTFVVPTGGQETRHMKVLSDPQVFIDPTSGLELRDPSVRAYASFIARCTAFDPEKRPATGGQFAAELAGLLDRHPLPLGRQGFIDVGWLAGALHRRVDLLGELQPAWVVSDGGDFDF